MIPRHEWSQDRSRNSSQQARCTVISSAPPEVPSTSLLSSKPPPLRLDPAGSWLPRLRTKVRSTPAKRGNRESPLSAEQGSDQLKEHQCCPGVWQRAGVGSLLPPAVPGKGKEQPAAPTRLAAGSPPAPVLFQAVPGVSLLLNVKRFNEQT